MATTAEGARESGCGAIGLVAALLALAGVLATLASVRARPTDATALLDAMLVVGELPFGLEPVDAAVLLNHEEMVRLARPEGPEGMEGVDPEAPTELVLVRYPRGAHDRARTFFRDEGFGFGGPGGRGGGPGGPGGPGSGGVEEVVMETGLLDWADLVVPFRHVRRTPFKDRDAYRDVVRVNLTTSERPLVAFVAWRAGQTASRARLDDLLRALGPREVLAAGASARGVEAR